VPDDKENLYLFEAIQLRDECNSHIRLLEKLASDNRDKTRGCLTAGMKSKKSRLLGLIPKR